MKKLTYVLGLSLLLWSCGPQNTESTAEAEETNTEMSAEEAAEAEMGEEEIMGKEINGMMSYGAEISAEEAIPGTELIAALGEQDSITVKVESGINSCCQKKGCWMKMDIGGDKELMVRFKDYGFFVPMDSEGKVAIVEGKVKKSVIPVDELKHYAEDAGKSQEEIDAITEPEEKLTFLADGVLIKG